MTACWSHNAVMSTLTVRKVPEPVMKSLKELAARNRRSVEEQVRQLLAETVADRFAACELIEVAWTRQARPTQRAEIAAWLSLSRP